MKPAESYDTFRAILKSRGRTLKSLTVIDAADLMLDFFRSHRVEGASPKMGDGMAYSFGIFNRKGKTPYELSLVRLFTTDDASPRPNGSRMRLSIGYRWTDAVTWFAQPNHGLPSGNSPYAWDENSVTALIDRLRSEKAYQVLSEHEPRSVELRHEPIWDVWG